MVVYRAKGRPDGRVTTIDHRETAPAAMRPDSFINSATGLPLPFNEARYSGLSVGIPGTVRGWTEALHRFGTISLDEALEPAIEVAQEGFTVDQTFFDQTQQNVDWFDDVPASAALFLDPDGTPHDVGTTFRNPDLARTYRLLASARRSATRTWRAPTDCWRAAARAASTPARWPMRSSARCGSHPSHRPRTTCGARG